jgi:hypothetical protein
MYKFPQIDVADLLGNTSLCTITPEVIWERLVTPQVKALLGDIEYSKVTVRETVSWRFSWRRGDQPQSAPYLRH